MTFEAQNVTKLMTCNVPDYGKVPSIAVDSFTWNDSDVG